MKNNELEIIFKDNQGNITMLWNNFIKNDEEHFDFDFKLKLSVFSVKTKLNATIQDIILFKDSLKDICRSKKEKSCFSPLGEFIKLDIVFIKNNTLNINGYIADRSIPQSNFSFSYILNNKDIIDWINELNKVIYDLFSLK